MVRATSARRTDAPRVIRAARITRWEVGARNRSGRVPASHGVGMLQRRPPAEPAAVPRPTVVISVSRPPLRGHHGTGRRGVSARGGGACRPTARCGQRGATGRKMCRRRAQPRRPLIRHRDSDHPAAHLIERRLAHNPGRSGDRQAIAGGAFFRASGRGAVGRYASPPVPANHRPPNSQTSSSWELVFLVVGS